MSTDSKPSTAHHVSVVDEIKADLSSLLERLDDLGFYQAGAHLSMSIHSLGPANISPFQIQEASAALN